MLVSDIPQLIHYNGSMFVILLQLQTASRFIGTACKLMSYRAIWRHYGGGIKILAMDLLSSLRIAEHSPASN